MRIYRTLIRLYPRRFRLEYGDDMVALFENQLRDERAPRVVARAVLDLLVSIPTRHLEAHMPRSTPTALVITFAAVAAALAIYGGLFGLVGAFWLLLLAGLLWRRNRPVVAAGDGRSWKLLLAGAGLLGTLVVVTTITGELPDGAWFVAMATMLTAFGLIAAGVVLGIGARFRTLPPA